MNRRSLLPGFLGAAVSMSRGNRSQAQVGQPGDLAGCLAEPGTFEPDLAGADAGAGLAALFVAIRDGVVSLSA